MSRGRADGLGFPIGLATSPVAYTPVVTWGANTITTQSGFYLKTPGKLEIWIAFIETVGTTGATITVTIPTGYTAVTLAGSLSPGVGTLCNNANGTMWGFVVVAGATTQITTPAATATAAVATWSGYFNIPTLT